MTAAAWAACECTARPSLDHDHVSGHLQGSSYQHCGAAGGSLSGELASLYHLLSWAWIHWQVAPFKLLEIRCYCQPDARAAVHWHASDSSSDPAHGYSDNLMTSAHTLLIIPNDS